TAANVEKEFANSHVVSETSYYLFYSKYLRTGIQDEVPSATREDLYADSVSFLIGLEDMRFQMSLNPPEENDMLMGFRAQEVFGAPQAWMDMLFDNHDARELMMETLHAIPYSQRSRKPYPLNRQDG